MTRLCFTIARAQMMELVSFESVMHRHAQISGEMRISWLDVPGRTVDMAYAAIMTNRNGASEMKMSCRRGHMNCGRSHNGTRSRRLRLTVNPRHPPTVRWRAAETAKDHRWQRPCTDLTYQPMQELLRYLRANGFKTYIVTGGGQDFVRMYSPARVRVFRPNRSWERRAA
jgi:hypothetical protein